MNLSYYSTRLGKIKIGYEDDVVKVLDFTDEIFETDEKSPFSDLVFSEISDYLEGRRKTFDIKIDPAGTYFQKKVRREVLKIPYGKTVSYGDLSKKIGKPKAALAVGGALNKNPILIIIPCHRVVGKRGDLKGYRPGLEIKKALLDLEEENKI